MLLPSQYRLLNADHYDAVPAALYRAKANANARQLAQADWLIREKFTGRYIGTITRGIYTPISRGGFQTRPFQHQTRPFQHQTRPSQHQPHQSTINSCADVWHVLGGFRTRPCNALQIDVAAYQQSTGLLPIAEPDALHYADKDRYGRPLWLEAQTQRSWQRMQRAAQHESISLQAISGFRSVHYQMGIFRRKLARGQHVNDILKVNAAPGFSEHHSGRAIDIGTEGEPAAEQSFELTTAFAWLMSNAQQFGFRLSYPRANPHGIGYEPWHWYWIGNTQS